MGESNCLEGQPSYIRRDVLSAASAIYHSLYGNEDGSLPLSYNILYFIAWKQSEKQGVPKARGSQTVSFKDMNTIMDKGKDKR